MNIKNIKGSSKISKKPPKPFTCWRDYWSAYSEFEFEEGYEYECPACKEHFTKKQFDGCHVQKVSSTDKKWYIIPLCDSCNHRTDEPDVDADLLIDVPSNLDEKIEFE